MSSSSSISSSTTDGAAVANFSNTSPDWYKLSFPWQLGNVMILLKVDCSATYCGVIQEYYWLLCVLCLKCAFSLSNKNHNCYARFSILNCSQWMRYFILFIEVVLYIVWSLYRMFYSVYIDLAISNYRLQPNDQIPEMVRKTSKKSCDFRWNWKSSGLLRRKLVKRPKRKNWVIIPH